MTLRRLFVITGDASGDVHGSVVIRRIQAWMPDVAIEAVGGPFIEATGVPLLAHQRDMGALGAGVLTAIPSHYRLGRRLLQHMAAWRPDAVLLIDYGMFNLWMASQLQKIGIKVFYYIPPQVWASRRGRIHQIKRHVDHVFGIFPFEKPLYEAHNIPFTFVGHPLSEQLPPPPDRETFCREYHLDPSLPIMGIFPGSRRSEVKNLLPAMIQAMPMIEAQTGQRFQFVLAKSPALSDGFFETLLAPLKSITGGVAFRILEHQNHGILALSQSAMVASGTVTLEASLYHTPVVIAYSLPTWAYALFRRFSYVQYIGLPNLLASAPFLPEVIMNRVTPNALAAAILPFLSDTPQRQQAETRFREIQCLLGEEPASANLVTALSGLMAHPLTRQPEAVTR